MSAFELGINVVHFYRQYNWYKHWKSQLDGWLSPQNTTHLMITSWYLCFELCNKTKSKLRLNIVGQADSLKI